MYVGETISVIASFGQSCRIKPVRFNWSGKLFETLYKTKCQMSKIILCADMDAFFASVEQQTNPCLRGKPIGIIGSSGRTVITTASYEARRFGIKTGMNIYEAKKIFPPLILVIGNNA